MDLVTYALVKKYAKNYTDEQVKQVIGEVFTVKGTIATVADLPTSGNRNGDIYLVIEDSSEYFYTSDGWEKFGPNFNVELFMQKGVDYVTAGQKAETILGDNATTEGKDTTASGLAAHAEGRNTVASGYYSHAEGFNTIAAGQNQHVFGQYNIADNQNTYVEIVGKGDGNARSNARTLDWQGNEVLAGKLTVGAPPTGNMDVATKKYVDDRTKDIDISTKANIDSPSFTGTPTAPDINNPSTSSRIVTATYLDSTLGTLDDDVEELKSKIPAEASASNQLADKEYVDTTKQDILVSGTNIKTINNQSILGSGNLDLTVEPTIIDITTATFDTVLAIYQSHGNTLNNCYIQKRDGTSLISFHEYSKDFFVLGVVDGITGDRYEKTTFTMEDGIQSVTIEFWDEASYVDVSDYGFIYYSSQDDGYLCFNGSNYYFDNDKNSAHVFYTDSNGTISFPNVVYNGFGTLYLLNPPAGCQVYNPQISYFDKNPKLIFYMNGGIESVTTYSFAKNYNDYVEYNRIIPPLYSPEFYGTPKAPTAAAGTNTTQIATTAFVKNEITSSITNTINATY